MRVKVFVSLGMVLLMVGCEPSVGVASMRKPVMVSTFERQVSVKEVSFTSVIRTRRGGLTSAMTRSINGHKTEQWIITGDDWKNVYLWCSQLPSSVVISPSSGLLVTEFFRA